MIENRDVLAFLAGALTTILAFYHSSLLFDASLVMSLLGITLTWLGIRRAEDLR